MDFVARGESDPACCLLSLESHIRGKPALIMHMIKVIIIILNKQHKGDAGPEDLAVSRWNVPLVSSVASRGNSCARPIAEQHDQRRTASSPRNALTDLEERGCLSHLRRCDYDPILPRRWAVGTRFGVRRHEKLRSS